MKSIIKKAVTFVSGAIFGMTLAMGGPSAAILNSEEPIYMAEDSFEDDFEDDLLLADASMDTDAGEGDVDREEDDSFDSFSPDYSKLPSGMVLVDTSDDQNSDENAIAENTDKTATPNPVAKQARTKAQKKPKKSRTSNRRSYRVASLLHNNTAKDVNPSLAPTVTSDQEARLAEVATTFENTLEKMVTENRTYENTTIIQSGDTLSKRFPSNWREIAEINSINPDLIIAGEVLFTNANQGTVSRQKRWNLMGSNPTTESVQVVTPFLDAPLGIRNAWMQEIKKSKSFSANIPWGTELKQVTYGFESGKTGSQKNVFALWTTPFGDEHHAVPHENAEVWLAETDLGDSYKYHALMKFERCQNLAWLTFQKTKEKPVEKDKVVTKSTPEPICPDLTCPEPRDFQPDSIILDVSVNRAPTNDLRKTIPRKPLGLKGISKLGTGSSNSISSGNNVYAGSMAFIGMRFQSRKSFVSWLPLNYLVDAGAAYEATSSHNMYVENRNRVLASVEPSIELMGFRFGGIIRGGPYEGIWDSMGYTVDWSTELPWNLYAQAGYASFYYNANDRHSEATYSAIYGQFGKRFFGNTVLAGIRTSVAKYDNPEYEARYRPMKQLPIGAFVKVDPFPNLYIQAAIWGDHQTGYDKVAQLMNESNVLQFSADVGYLFFF